MCRRGGASARTAPGRITTLMYFNHYDGRNPRRSSASRQSHTSTLDTENQRRKSIQVDSALHSRDALFTGCVSLLGARRRKGISGPGVRGRSAPLVPLVLIGTSARWSGREGRGAWAWAEEKRLSDSDRSSRLGGSWRAVGKPRRLAIRGSRRRGVGRSGVEGESRRNYQIQRKED